MSGATPDNAVLVIRNNKLKYILSVLTSVCITLGLIHGLPKAHYPVDEVAQATHSLTVFKEGGMYGQVQASCSSVAISPNIVLTAAHCDGYGIQVDGKAGVIIKEDKDHDLMLVYVEGLNSPTVKLANSAPKTGDDIMAYGYPAGMFIGFVPFEVHGKVRGTAKVPPGFNLDRFNGYMIAQMQFVGGESGGGVFKREDGHYVLVSVVSMGDGDLAVIPSYEMVREFVK